MFKQRKRRVDENCIKKLEPTKIGKYFQETTSRTRQLAAAI
jgi:hypothetical protein